MVSRPNPVTLPYIGIGYKPVCCRESLHNGMPRSVAMGLQVAIEFSFSYYFLNSLMYSATSNEKSSSETEIDDWES
uniref:Uncharacterized protein n=1 Tax=Nelumbo nucifera TaxID=4432 RepID=A0A822YNK1_NELNU|nr:TPA_asm: hypothetical protein HUJ06_004737 [Nelumbo nucifera]